jgi:hypothetical protein
VRPLALQDLPTPEAFLAERDARRRGVIALKKVRRVAVGPHASLVFENRDTLLWQVLEMCRVEGIRDDAGRRAELDVYNALVPRDGGLAATMFLEFESEALLKTWLPRLPGIEGRVRLEFAGRAILAASEDGRSRNDYTASVHYLHFPFTAADRRAFGSAPRVSVAIDHPAYGHAALLAPETRASLAADLAS